MAQFPASTPPIGDGTFSFTPIGVGDGSDRVTVSPGSIHYEARYANWLTWTLVIFTVGIAACPSPWIRFGKRSETLLRNQISAVRSSHAGRGVKLIIETPTEHLEFRTHSDTAEQAIRVLSSTP